MNRAKDRRQRRSAARRRAESHATGYETTVLKMPEGVGFWSLKTGTHKIDIVPYKVGKGNPWADEGMEYYERTYYSYRRIGAEEKSYCAPGKTFGHPDPIAEWCAKQANRDDVDPKYLKTLAQKERQLFLIWDHAEPEKGIQIWDCSFHLFGKLLDSRLKNSTEEDNWDQFDDPSEDGFTLRVTIEQQSGGGYNFNAASAIDFLPRKSALPDNIINHGICLDDLLIEFPYDKLKAIFLGSVDSDDDEPEAPAKTPETAHKEPSSPNDGEGSGPVSEAAKDMPKASDFGIEKGSSVAYEGKACIVMKVSGDGTSLMLIEEEDDDQIHRGVAPEDVVVNASDNAPEGREAIDEPKSEDSPTETVGSPKADATADGSDDDWDKDWD